MRLPRHTDPLVGSWSKFAKALPPAGRNLEEEVASPGIAYTPEDSVSESSTGSDCLLLIQDLLRTVAGLEHQAGSRKVPKLAAGKLT
jgi:hypothetical protein